LVAVALSSAAVARAAQGPGTDSATARSVALLRAEGLVHEQKGECSRAIVAYSKALEIDPRNTFLIGHRALCQHQLGNEAQALADSERALAANPGWIELRAVRANIFFMRNDKTSAAREAKALVDDNPGVQLALDTAGQIYSELGFRSEARAAFDRAHAIGPSPDVLTHRAQSRAVSDKAGRLADLDAALKLAPGNPEALSAKAGELAVDGNLKGAIRLYDRALKIAPDWVDLKLDRAIALYRSGQTAAATNELRTLRAKAKTYHEFNNLCWTKAAANILLDLALEECREALKVAPERAVGLDSTALVLLRLGRLDEAIAHYDKAIAAMTFPAPYFGRALAYARKGDRQRSEADRQQALALDPDIEAQFARFGLTLSAR
jgi:tetratricopeptide (TPR) repeat protein